MGIFRRTPEVVPLPSLTEQAATASVNAGMYTAMFQTAAEGLEREADNLDAIREAAAEEASRNLALKLETEAAAFTLRQKATKIKDLIA